MQNCYEIEMVNGSGDGDDSRNHYFIIVYRVLIHCSTHMNRSCIGMCCTQTIYDCRKISWLSQTNAL